MVKNRLRNGFLALLAFGMVASGGSAKTETGPEGRILRVMTYNIHHGAGLDGEVDLDRIAGVIAKEKPDFVGLQEVDNGIARSGNRDLTKILSRLTKMTGYFESNLSYGGGEYGNAWLSRHPIVEKANLHYEHLHQGEPRGLLQIVVEVEGEKLLLLNTHLSHRGVDAEDRAHSLAQAKEVIAKHPGLPVIFIGDFNDTPGSALYEKLTADFIDCWEAGEGEGLSFPADKPDRRIDFIWVSRESGLSPRRAWVPATEASDHRPVVAEIEWEK